MACPPLRVAYAAVVDWSLLQCARRGHITYAPDEPGLRDRLSTTTAAGPSWRCLRCGTFVPGEPVTAGPGHLAPRVRRGKELRGVAILRFFAVERAVRTVVVVLVAYAVWRFQSSRAPFVQAFNHELPRLEPLFSHLGYDLDQSKLVAEIRRAFTLDSATLRWFAVGLLVYAAIEVTEAAGLWLAKRWGEYFAMVATSAGLPLEIYELAHKITMLRAGAFLLNVALVVYLVYAKRLFGVRGGAEAYEARLRSESIMEFAIEAHSRAEAQRPVPATSGGPAGRPAGQAQSPPPPVDGPGLTEATNSSAAE